MTLVSNYNEFMLT